MSCYPFKLVRHNHISYDYELYDGDDKISIVFQHVGDEQYDVHYARLVKNENGTYKRIITADGISSNAKKLFWTVGHICLQFITKDNPNMDSINFDFITDRQETRINIFLMLVDRILPPEFGLYHDDEVLYIMRKDKAENLN
jgi:hypothetical protein